MVHKIHYLENIGESTLIHQNFTYQGFTVHMILSRDVS